MMGCLPLSFLVIKSPASIFFKCLKIYKDSYLNEEYFNKYCKEDYAEYISDEFTVVEVKS
mgnify:CR=1 FL=1